MVDIHKGIEIIIRHQIAFAGLDVGGKHDETDLIPKEPVLEASIKGQHRRVIQVRVGRPLLEVEREHRELSGRGTVRIQAAGGVEQFKQLPAALLAVVNARKQRIKNVVLTMFHPRSDKMGIKRWNGPNRV